MSEEELSINVRWKRPARRAIPIVIGAISIGAGAIRLVEQRGHESIALPAQVEREWSCAADERGRSSGMSEEQNTDRSRRSRRDADTAHLVLLEEQLTRRIIGAFYHVYNRLGYGHLETVYRDALAIELRKRGVEVVVEQRIDVWYDGHVVGVYRADLIAEGVVVIEIKAGRSLDGAAHAQLLNYLTCSDIQVGLLLHFGPSPKFHRAIRTRNGERMQAPPTSALPAPIRDPSRPSE